MEAIVTQNARAIVSVIFVLGALVAALATIQFAAGGPLVAGVTLLAISVVLLFLGGCQVGRSRS